jgi:hypothetical protein
VPQDFLTFFPNKHGVKNHVVLKIRNREEKRERKDLHHIICMVFIYVWDMR